jgi:hypothetical protein
MSKADIAISLNGWFAYAQFADTYHLRKRVFLKAQEIFLEKRLYNASCIN